MHTAAVVAFTLVLAAGARAADGQAVGRWRAVEIAVAESDADGAAPSLRSLLTLTQMKSIFSFDRILVRERILVGPKSPLIFKGSRLISGMEKWLRNSLFFLPAIQILCPLEER